MQEKSKKNDDIFQKIPKKYNLRIIFGRKLPYFQVKISTFACKYEKYS